MKSLKLFLYIQLIFLVVIFCNCYKYSCKSRHVFKKLCYLLLSVTEESYKFAFSCAIPKDLKKRLLLETAVDRFQNVGPLTNTNSLIKRSLTKKDLKCIAAAFDYGPKNIAGIMIFPSETAVKNYNRKCTMTKLGKRICNGNFEYFRMSWSDYTRNIARNKDFIKKMKCLNTCSSFN